MSLKKLGLVLVGIAIVAPLLLSACNTLKGAGQDIQAGGTALTKAASK